MCQEPLNAPAAPPTRRGLVIVNTGHGKGKTPAALGMVLRAWGRDMRVCVIQFIKAGSGKWGEVQAARRMGLEWHTLGDGFTWRSQDMQTTIQHAQAGWALAQEKIRSAAYDLIVLDEFTYPLIYNWLDLNSVLEWLRAHRPPALHLALTGRDAPPELIEFADLVTEMQVVKHPYEQGLKAQPGIEY